MEFLVTLFKVDMNYMSHPLSLHFLLSFVFFSFVVFLIIELPKSKFSIMGLRNFLFPKSIYNYKTIKTDVKLSLINWYVEGFIAKIFFSASTFAALTLLLLEKNFPHDTSPQAWTFGTLVSFTLFMFFFSELVRWMTHFLLHKIDFLWEIHKIHHSAKVMNIFVGLRFNFLYFFVKPFLKYPLIGGTQALAIFLLNKENKLVTILGMNIFFATIYFVMVHFQHSHYKISFGPFWGKLITSPRYHQLHHSKAPEHRDKNFAFYFAFFDWIFGTQVLPPEDEEFEYGIIGSRQETENSLYACIVLPCYAVGRVLQNRIKKLLFL